MTTDSEPQLAPGPLPRHVAIIMDGNGRWAQQRGLPRLEGHTIGSDSVRDIVTTAREAGIEALTLYAFSSQNWSRPDDEVAGLIRLLYDYLDKERATILKNDIRLQAIGEVHRFPDFVQERIAALAAESSNNTSMVLTLALSYGGREELVEAAKRIARSAKDGSLDPESIDAETIESSTFTHDLPPLDLVIRTSGELRLSNFLLWQVAYAELVFTDTLWPDFRKPHFFDAILEYRGRQRRYGKTGDQVETEEG